jgi:hypothetical protein
MHQETLTYQADGLTMRSRPFVDPAPGPRAGVLVFPEAYDRASGAARHARLCGPRLRPAW